jgi:hypothetical protein
MAVFALFHHDPAKPRLSIRQRLHNTAMRIMPRMSRAHKKGGGGTDTARRAVMAGTLAVAAVGTLPALAEANKDAELLRLGAVREAAFALANAEYDDNSDEALTARCNAFRDPEFLIHNIPAHTIEGLAVKARIAMEYATPKDPNSPVLDDVIVSLIEDVLRIAGAKAA